MKDQDLISVIIPVYNMEKYLHRCLDSVCKNTYGNLEIICVNDGSTDSSIEILREYENKDNRIIIIDQENKKLSASRNAGLEIAKGRWIALIDSDDWIHPQYFEILLHFANRENADVSICDSITTYDSDSTDELFVVNDIGCKLITKKELDKLHIIRSRVWGKLYRRDIIGDLRFISGAEPIEDYCFNTILFDEQMKFCMVDSKLYYYFMREDSAIHNNTGRQSLAYIQHMVPLIAKETNQKKKQEIIKRCYNVLLSSRYLEMYSKDYESIKETINAEFRKLKQYRRNLSTKDRLIYKILCSSPGLYRMWRILDDPTLLQHEANLKKRSS